MDQKRKQPSDPSEPEPPTKKRNLDEILEEAPPEWKDMYEERKSNQQNLHYVLKPELVQDEFAQSVIIKHAKNNEILGTRYSGYVQVTDLYEPIWRYPIAVCNPFVKIIGSDDLYIDSPNAKIRRLNNKKKRGFLEKEPRRLQLINEDKILDALRLYDPVKKWSNYVTTVLGSTALAESRKYKLTAGKKRFIPDLLQDAKFLSIKLRVAQPLSNLESTGEAEEVIYPDLRDKIIEKKELRATGGQKNGMDLEVTINQDTEGRQVNTNPLPIKSSFSTDLPQNQDTEIVEIELIVEENTEEVPSCTEQSMCRALSNEVAEQYSLEAPVSSNNISQSELDTPEPGFAPPELQLENQPMPIDSPSEPPSLEQQQLDQCKNPKNCQHPSCYHRFLKNLSFQDSEDSRNSFLKTENYAEVKTRVNNNLKSGIYKCVFKDMRKKPPVIVLAPNPEMVRASPFEFFTDEQQFVQSLKKARFRENVINNNYVIVDIEGIHPLSSWMKKNPPKGPPKAPAVSVIHFTDPKGFSCEIQCLFDGCAFKGASIPEYLLELLSNPNVVNVGSGITQDMITLNAIFEDTGRKFHPSLEVSQLLMLLKPVDKNDLKQNEKPPNGKEAVAQYLGLGHLLGRDPKVSFQVGFDPNNKKHFADFTQNPRMWTEKMFLYNRLDRFLGLAMIDRAVVRLAKMYHFPEQPDKDIGILRLSLFALLADFTIFEKAFHTVGKFVIPPMNIFQEYSPFCDYLDHVGYPHPTTIMHNLSRLIGNRNLLSEPMIFSGEWSETKSLTSCSNPRKDWSLIIQEFKDIPFPHSCSECHSYDHLEEDCDDMELLLEECKYPLCHDSYKTHTLQNCPVLIHRCTFCDSLGHLKEHHQIRGFDILKGLVTYRGFVHKHRFAGIIFSREAIPKLRL